MLAYYWFKAFFEFQVNEMLFKYDDVRTTNRLGVPGHLIVISGST